MSYRMQHGGGSQALEELDRARRLKQMDERTEKLIDIYRRTGRLPHGMSPETLSHVASRLFLTSTPSPKKRCRRRKTRRRQFGIVNRTTSSSTPLLTDQFNVWSSTDGSFTRDDLKYWFYRFRWDVIITVPKLSVHRPTRWLEPFHAAIDSPELFPCSRRYTDESPSWFPLSFRDANDVETIFILLALPPGALQLNLETLETVQKVLEKAVHDTFDAHVTPKVRMVNQIKLDELSKRLVLTPFQCVTRFIRPHNRKCRT